jgi:phosphoribosylformylglycinamidine (FGAM) synthase-like enzyme
MGAKGDLGIELDLDQVPVREENMSAYEMMLSESQERMLMVLEPGEGSRGQGDLRQMGPRLRHRRQDHRHLRFRRPAPGRDASPTCRSRNWATKPRNMTGRGSRSAKAAGLCRNRSRAGRLWPALHDPDRQRQRSSRRWVWEQYDTLIQGNTAADGRAATPAWCASTARRKGLAFSSDVTPRYCEADPYEGGKQAVAECWRNLTAVGADAAGGHRQPQFRQSRTA